MATRILCPYGILYSSRGWLVAHALEFPEMRKWRLYRIVSVNLLGRNFDRQADFSLAKYAAKAFCVFHEEPQDVILQFAPELAEDKARWVFHSTEMMETHMNGSHIAQIECGEILELPWHFYTYCDKFEVCLLKSSVQW